MKKFSPKVVAKGDELLKSFLPLVGGVVELRPSGGFRTRPDYEGAAKIAFLCCEITLKEIELIYGDKATVHYRNWKEVHQYLKNKLNQ